MLKQLLLTVVVAAMGVVGVPCRADSTVIDVSFDRWMYPFNASAGARPNGSTFGAVGVPDFDDRDAQILVGFDTSTMIPTGAGGNYEISSAKLRIFTASDEAIVLDSTYDAYTTYLDDSTDEDPGRPVELYGIGFRNGYFSANFGPTIPGPPGFEEADFFGIPGPPVPANQTRNVFATDGVEGRDISNNVREGFDPSPWAIGNVAGLAAGDPVPQDAMMEFEVDLTNSEALAHLQAGLNDGSLFFAASSMHTSVQGSQAGIPLFHLGTLDGDSLGQRAQLEIDYAIVPEPASIGLLGFALLFLGLRLRRK